MLNAKLIVVGGDAKAGEVRLRLPCIIGRGKEATLTLPHPLVSRQHCEIFEQDGGLVVRDLGSMNGTYVDNRKIEGVEELAPGKLLTLGNVTFRASYEVGEMVEDAPVEDAQSQDGAPTAAPESEQLSAIEQQETVEESESDGDTDKSLPSIEVSDEVEDQSEEPSRVRLSRVNIDDSAIKFTEQVEVDAIAGLPAEEPAVSFKGNVDLGDDPCRQAVESKIELELGEEKKVDPDDQLDSFLKKLPR